MSFAPARVVVVAEVKGGPDDFEEFYCPSVEWEWGDLTTSTAEADCEPFEPGKSQIKRRYTVEHRFKNPGGFKIILRLKKGDRIIAMANTQVQVRPGSATVSDATDTGSSQRWHGLEGSALRRSRRMSPRSAAARYTTGPGRS